MRMAVTDRSGRVHAIDGAPGQSLMDAIRNAGIEDLQAVCGGCCSCATCHVYVLSKPAEPLPSMAADEDALLDGTSHRTTQSRLACQVHLDAGHDGLEVAIAPED